MKRAILFILTVSVLAVASTASATPPGSGGYGSGEVVCDRACFDAIFGQGGVPGPVDPGAGANAGGDNASAICKDHGGLYAVEYLPGYGFNGENVIVTVVKCMDGHQETIGGIVKNDTNDPGDGGSGSSDPPPPPPATEPDTTYVQCPGTDDPRYDPNDPDCW